ncbi:hypothetical protein ANANG_G00185050 [Anguilla anguilla]|uniref:WAS/WASL interacting protein family member 3 n=1 Tax=Anguilla anguilla TaxID=7936 RepID=A0A9D3M794_ANGAN|nr:hypothetical protein ANANG_G00185050 [Anguilla anguilla]
MPVPRPHHLPRPHPSLQELRRPAQTPLNLLPRTGGAGVLSWLTSRKEPGSRKSRRSTTAARPSSTSPKAAVRRHPLGGRLAPPPRWGVCLRGGSLHYGPQVRETQLRAQAHLQSPGSHGGAPQWLRVDMALREQGDWLRPCPREVPSTELSSRTPPPPPPPPPPSSALRNGHLHSLDDFESKFQFHPVDDFPPPEDFKPFPRIYPSKAGRENPKPPGVRTHMR